MIDLKTELGQKFKVKRFSIKTKDDEIYPLTNVWVEGNVRPGKNTTFCLSYGGIMIDLKRLSNLPYKAMGLRVLGVLKSNKEILVVKCWKIDFKPDQYLKAVDAAQTCILKYQKS